MNVISVPSNPSETGLEVIDLESYPAFAERKLHSHDSVTQLEGLQQLARCFVENPDLLLQELVNAAIVLCGAESAGVSMEREDKTEESYYHWVATAGKYTTFMNAVLPREPSACTICLQRGRPQLFRVYPRFFELMGIEAETVTDGILMPWEVDGTRGTIWIMAHGRTEAFDGGDVRLMQVLANFAAMGVRQQRQQRKLLAQVTASAAATMANDLAHQINNPLQSLTNVLFLATEDKRDTGGQKLARKMQGDFERLSTLVKKLLVPQRRGTDALTDERLENTP